MSLARHQFTVQDGSGNFVAGAHVEVRLEVPGQPLVPLYSDRAGTVGITNPSDADSNGYWYAHAAGGAYQIRVYTGPSGAPITEHIDRYVAIGINSESDSAAQRTQRKVTAAGAVTVIGDDADDIIIAKTVGAATTVNLPASASRTKPVKIVDGKGDANTNNITITVQTGESMYAIVNGTAIIDGNGGSVQLTPKQDGTGWF